jgi:hypothetical protein
MNSSRGRLIVMVLAPAVLGLGVTAYTRSTSQSPQTPGSFTTTTARPESAPTPSSPTGSATATTPASSPPNAVPQSAVPQSPRVERRGHRSGLADRAAHDRRGWVRARRAGAHFDPDRATQLV